MKDLNFTESKDSKEKNTDSKSIKSAKSSENELKVKELKEFKEVELHKEQKVKKEVEEFQKAAPKLGAFSCEHLRSKAHGRKHRGTADNEVVSDSSEFKRSFCTTIRATSFSVS